MPRPFRSALPLLTLALFAGLAGTAAASAPSSVPIRDMSLNGITAYTVGRSGRVACDGHSRAGQRSR
jgi:hypothetical protein